MSQQELVKRVINALEMAGIDYMATGSIVSSIQGEPRATHDFDIVISVDRSQIIAIVAAFPPPEFHVDEEIAREAADIGGSFNLIDARGGNKVDFWILTDEPYDQMRFSRAVTLTIFGENIRASAPEDTILMKLRWALLSGGSDKQFGDALRVYEVQYANLDIDYMNIWAKKLGIDDLWLRLQNQASPL